MKPPRHALPRLALLIGALAPLACSRAAEPHAPPSLAAPSTLEESWLAAVEPEAERGARTPVEASPEERSGAAVATPQAVGGGTLVGRVVDDRGTPVGSATVYAQSETVGPPLQAQVDEATGRFRLGGLEPGPWTVGAVVMAEERFSAPREFLVFAGEEAQVELVLPRLATLEGTVVDAGGRGVRAELIGQVSMPGIPYDNADWSPMGATDASGAFRIPAQIGSAHLYARAEGFASSGVITLATRPAAVHSALVLQLTPSGRVDLQLLDENGVPAAGYPVRVSDREYRFDETHDTDGAGRATFVGLHADVYNVEVLEVTETDVGLVWDRLVDESFRLAEGERRQIELRAPSRPNEVEVLLRLEFPEGLRSESVHFSQLDGDHFARAMEGPDGRLVATLPEAGSYSLVADSSELGIRWFQRVEVPRGSTHELAIALEAVWISGRVTGTDGGPMPGVEVRAFCMRDGEPHGQGWGRTDAQGNYTLPAPAGTCELAADARGTDYALARIEGLALVPGAHLEGQDMTLDLGGRVSGRVVRGDGTPVDRAFVSLDASDGELTDAEGHFRFEGVAAGRRRLGALGQGLALLEPVEVQVVSGQETSVLLTLAPAGFVKVRVLDREGQGLVADVSLRDRGSQAQWSGYALRRTGDYEFAPLPLGTYRVSARRGERTVEREIVLDETVGAEYVELVFD